MMPFSGYMDSNPHLRNQPPYPHHYFPGFETVRPHSKADPSQSSMMYEFWPCSSNCSRYPVPYHGCCSHGNFPGYYSYRPPCPHFAPSPAFHHYPNYPTFTEPYPAYCVHPPYYSNEQPRYEYDKDPHTNYHCCGCPNHVHNQKNDRGLKIEEQENDTEKKEGDLVVPIQPRSFPYPIMWIPPESMNSKERGKHNDRIELSDSNKAPCVEKPPKSSKPTDQQPKVWNGWFPLDMNGWQSLTQGEGEKQSQNQQKQDKMMQLPFPFFWVPNSDRKQEADENQDKRRLTTASDNSKQAPITLEYVPVEPSASGVKIDKPQSDIEGSQNKNAAETKGKAPSQKCVPVEVKEGKSEGTEKRGTGVKDVSVKRAGDASKDGLGTIAKTKSPSPPKTSKLPPVCLRVDPLPKKKNGNGSSRSPSPPKGQSKDTLTKASTTPGKKEDSAVNTQNISGSLDNVEPGEKKIKYIPVVEERPKENKAGENQAQVSGSLSIKSEEVSGQPTMEKSKKDSHESKTEEETKASFEEVMGAEKGTGIDKAANIDELAHGQCKAETKTMSDDEAAKLIQSAFRGFEVRKWEPLKKLKQLADVREQLNEVRSRVQSLESSSICDKDDKLRLLIGEKIMTLLLRLDTIQGYHSSVRDARKSLVKELVTLQEKLDALASKWAEEKIKDVATSESADSSDRASGNVGMEEEGENASAAFEDTNENSNNVKEPDQECSKHTEDGKDGKDEESTELPGVEHGLDAKIESNTVEVNIEHHTAPGIEEKDVSPSLEHMTHMSSVPEQKFDTDELVEVNDISKEENPEVVEVNDQIPVENNSEDDKLSSLPKADHEVAVCEPEKEIGDNNTETESDLPINPSLADEVEDMKCTHTDKEIDLLKELPVGVIDEEPAISKIDEHSTEAVSNYSPKDQKEDEFTTSGEPPEVEMEQKVNDDNKFEPVFKPEEAHSTTGEGNEPVEVHSTLDEENNDEHEDDSGAIPADHTASSESEAGSESTQEKEVLFEEKKPAEQPVRTEEKEETKLGREIDMLQYNAPSESNANHGLAMTGEDNKLMEENKKLKEIMEKVMEAGKDQVSVISKLAERVKELEEKLANNKKSSRRGYRKVRYAPSYKYNKPLKSRAAAEVAM